MDLSHNSNMPFSLGELQPRMRALLRRSWIAQGGDEIRVNDIVMNLASRRAFMGERELFLSPKEFSIKFRIMKKS